MACVFLSTSWLCTAEPSNDASCVIQCIYQHEHVGETSAEGESCSDHGAAVDAQYSQLDLTSA